MMFARTVDAGPYVATSAGCPTAQPCLNPTPGNSQIVGLSTDSNVYGVSADISTHQPNLCRTPPAPPYNGSGSAAWSMLAPTSNNSPYSYAQAGYMYTQNPNRPLQYFTQYRQDGSQIPQNNKYFIGSPSPGSTHTYAEFYDFAAGQIDMTVDGIIASSTNFDPIVTPAWQGAWMSAWAAETLNPADDVPGTVTAKTVFGNLGVQTTRGGGYGVPRGLQVGSHLPGSGRGYYRYSGVVSGPAQLSIWTPPGA